MRLAPQEGQNPRRLHENATSFSCAHCPQRKRTKPWARIRVSALRVQDMTFDAHRHEPEVLPGAPPGSAGTAFNHVILAVPPGALTSLVMTRGVDPGRRVVDRLP